MTTSTPPTLGIAEVAELTGLSRDTLRWYEREGLIPAIARDTSGYRSYDAAAVAVINLVVRLRRTGMPIARMRTFVELVAQGAASHPERLDLLAEHRVHVADQLAVLTADLAAIDAKVDHYTRLIAAGRDCAGEPTTQPQEDR